MNERRVSNSMPAPRMTGESPVKWSSIYRSKAEVEQPTGRVRMNIDHLLFELAAMMSVTAIVVALLFVGTALERHSPRPLLGAKSMSYTSIPAVRSVDAPIHYI
jgi:hypothetical protein